MLPEYYQYLIKMQGLLKFIKENGKILKNTSTK